MNEKEGREQIHEVRTSLNHILLENISIAKVAINPKTNKIRVTINATLTSGIVDKISNLKNTSAEALLYNLQPEIKGL